MSESENNKENDDVKEENGNNDNLTEVTAASPVPDADAGAIANLSDKSSLDKIAKVDILLNATGNVPIMKKRKWSVDPEKPISWVIKFIHKFLKLSPEDKLFLYVNQTFAPSPDQIIKNLYDCYGTNGKLVLYYCKSQAWG